MFVLLMPGTTLNKGIFFAGSPSMSFLVIYFAPALQSGYFPGGSLKSSLVSAR
jgi:hypothetical protein